MLRNFAPLVHALGRAPMPSIFTHPAVPLAIAAAVGRAYVSPRLPMAGIFAFVLPDAGVLAFRVGIAYSSQFGHRGFTHSFVFAVAIGAIALLLAPWLRTKRSTAFLFVGTACASHGLLDMLTNGGLGVAWLWPFRDERFFFSKQVIEVALLSLRRFFSPVGMLVILSEICWVWLPAAAVVVGAVLLRRKHAA